MGLPVAGPLAFWSTLTFTPGSPRTTCRISSMIDRVLTPPRSRKGTKLTVMRALFGVKPGSGGAFGSEVFSPIWVSTASTTSS